MSTADHWSKKHQKYKSEDWIDKPSLFAETAITYFPNKAAVLELGAGQGQDSRYFAAHGYRVVSTDLEDGALDLNRRKTPVELAPQIDIQKLDLTQPFPFADATFEVVYAHLSLHYFADDTTRRIFAEIYRVLKPGGVLAFLVNSAGDKEYGAGEQIEADFFKIGEFTKRFFTVEAAEMYAERFAIQLSDGEGETYKDRAKGVHNLIRFIGRKQ
jgi:SAM-dependent methyltransferase